MTDIKNGMEQNYVVLPGYPQSYTSSFGENMDFIFLDGYAI